MKAKIIDGKAIAKDIREELKALLSEKFKEKDLRPKLVAIGATEEKTAELFAKSQKKAAEEIGILFQVENLGPHASYQAIEEKIMEYSNDKNTSGIILIRPLPQHLDVQKLQSLIPAIKDVEGIHPANLGSVYFGIPLLSPCTAMAAFRLILSERKNLEGAEAVVVGHSEIVGKPLAILLMNSLATTTVCHIGTRDLAKHTKEADILAVAVGKPGLIKKEMVKPGAMVIDIGINRIKTSEGKIKTVGDVDFEEVSQIAGAITPVPGGVGPVTVSILMENTIKAALLQQNAG